MNFKDAIQPDMQPLSMKRLRDVYRNNLKILLILNGLYYVVENVLGVNVSPSSHDLILLLLGWVSQDQYRTRGLQLVIKS